MEAQLKTRDLQAPPPPTSEDLAVCYHEWLRTPAPYHVNGKWVANALIRREMVHFGQGQKRTTEAGWVALSAAMRETPERVWFWSDLHLWHRRICQMAGRPFESVNAMNHALLAGAQAKVDHKDWLVFLGDLSFGTEADTAQWLRQCPGRKAIIVGNHDLERGKPDYKLVWSQFEAIGDCMAVPLASPRSTAQWGDLDRLWLTHYPLWNSWVPFGTLNMHGHIHDQTLHGARLNLSVEQTDYAPQRLSDVLNWVAKTDTE